MAMNALQVDDELYTPAQLGRPIVIVGTGPVGIRVAQEIMQRKPGLPIVLYGGEPWEPYNRVRLSSLLSGEASLDAIQNPLQAEQNAPVIQHHNCPVVRIDRSNRSVTDARGYVQPYSDLILATGSSPHIPSIPGVDTPGVFTFRDMNDTQSLMARRAKSRRTLVLGGGLLGLEAAKGMLRAGTDVTVVDHALTLMPRQLDDEAAERLRAHVLSLGIQVLLNEGIAEILSEDNHVRGVRLRSGREIACDTVLLATGIKPNIELARDARIAVGRGVRVNEQLRTSDPHVYAVGECAEYRDTIYGLVAPGLEQAAVLADNLSGGKSRYLGSLAATRLKVVGTPVFSMGRTGINEQISGLQRVAFTEADGSSYRSVFLYRDRIVGALGVGQWNQLSRVQEAVQKRRRVWPWQLRRFHDLGNLWPEAEAEEISLWPANATVCQCNSVTCGTLTQAIQAGCTSVETLARATGASTVCGSCKPLLAELVDSSAPLAPEKGHRTLITSAVASLLLMLAFLILPNIPYPDSVQVAFRWDQLWRDSLLKQISGFTLLGLGVLISIISLRKRIKAFSLGSFNGWRVLHVSLAVLVAATLVAHTGLRLGDSLNFMLMFTFVLLMLVGAVAGGAIGLQHALPRKFVQRTRAWSLHLHIWLLWPLPALLGFHIFKTYWF